MYMYITTTSYLLFRGQSVLYGNDMSLLVKFTTCRWKHLIQPRYLTLANVAEYIKQQNKTFFSFHGNGCHRNSIFQNPWKRDTGQSIKGVSSVRNLWMFSTTDLVHDGHYEGTLYIRLNKPTRINVFRRSLSSETDVDERQSTEQIVEDSVEDVVKELEAEGTELRKPKKEKGSSSGSLKDSMKSVGRLVPDKIVNLLDEDGESLGTVHRDVAIQRSRESRLKLVLVNPNSQPYPTYRLMTGQQLHQEQMLLRDKLRNKSAPTQVKEARMSGNIARHDLEVKRRQVHDWFKDGQSQVHVRVTIMGGSRGHKKVTQEQQLAVIDQLMSGLEDRVTFSSKPRGVGKDGMNLTVVLRPMSAKEKAALVKQRNKEEGFRQHPTGDDAKRTGDGEAMDKQESDA